jgi:hypothetical protein
MSKWTRLQIGPPIHALDGNRNLHVAEWKKVNTLVPGIYL